MNSASEIIRNDINFCGGTTVYQHYEGRTYGATNLYWIDLNEKRFLIGVSEYHERIAKIDFISKGENLSGLGGVIRATNLPFEESFITSLEDTDFESFIKV